MGIFKRQQTEEQERARLGKAAVARELRVREARIKAHLSAIKGVEAQRELMGDKWAEATIAYRVRELKKLGVEL